MVRLIFEKAIKDLQNVLEKAILLEPELQRLGDAMMTCWDRGGKVLIAGNGGSAADAMHFTEELVVRYRKNRAPRAAIALCDPTVLTCAGNDLGFDEIFARQVLALGSRHDVLIVMTTSGNSPNILRALAAAKTKGMVTAGFLGGSGGHARQGCDIALIVPSADTARIQEIHKLLYHTLCEWVDTKTE